MIDRLAADAVVLVHLAFIVFVVAGALLLLRDARWAWLHAPAALWGAYAELTATLCPLTPLENALRRRAGAAGYEGGFVEHYLIPLDLSAGARAFAPALDRCVRRRAQRRALRVGVASLAPAACRRWQFGVASRPRRPVERYRHDHLPDRHRRRLRTLPGSEDLPAQDRDW